MLPSRRAREESSDETSDEGVEESYPNTRQLVPQAQRLPQPAQATGNSDLQRPAKRTRVARATGQDEFKGEQPIDTNLWLGYHPGYAAGSLSSQYAHHRASQMGIFPQDYIQPQPQPQPLGVSLSNQDQAQNQFPFFQQRHFQQQLMNPSLISLLGSAHQHHRQIPTLHGAPLLMNSSFYSDRASLRNTGTSNMFLPMGSLLGPPPSLPLSGSSFQQYFQHAQQLPTSLPFASGAHVSHVPTQPPLDISEMSLMGVQGPQSLLNLDLAMLHPQQHTPFASRQSAAFPTTSTLHVGDSAPSQLPVLLARAEDHDKLSPHQILLRSQIEAFEATEEDVSTYTRGRNKPITLGQVGIRCRHCKHLPVASRQKGAAYFPATLSGLYQAAQNMSTTHMQCGLCSEMPMAIKHQFAMLMSTKASSSGAGRPYWAESARKLGLVDTSSEGIRFVRDTMPASLPPSDEGKSSDEP